MIVLGIDSYYSGSVCSTAAIRFKINNSEILSTHVVRSIVDEDYIPGQFYKRELKGIIQLLKQVSLDGIDAIIIDGYVYTSDLKDEGLGLRLFSYLDERISVIGVAKNEYKGTENVSIKLYRGISKKPLYVSSIGIEKEIALELVKNLRGDNRTPDILVSIDRLSRAKLG